MLLLTGCAKKNSQKTYFTDIDEGVKNAKELNQNILLCVTMPGSDNYSQNFIKKVFMNENFQNETMRNYTVILFDFSQDAYQMAMVQDGMSDAQKEVAAKQLEMMRKNFSVANDLNIKVTPAVVLLTKDKYFISQVDYTAERASYTSFKYALEKEQEKIKRINSLVDNVKLSTGMQRVPAIDSLYNATPQERRGLLKDLVNELLTLDKDNQSGLVNKYLMIKAENLSLQYFSEGKIEEAANSYLDICSNPYMKSSDIQQAYYLAAMILGYSGNQDYAKIINYLQLAIEADPESENVSQIQILKDSVANVSNLQ